uniref:Uncharacterized protein n=1 Tax=Anguilla anguilla TaxID=7936 RepID=A0A0E9VCT9_ANGAN
MTSYQDECCVKALEALSQMMSVGLIFADSTQRAAK